MTILLVKRFIDVNIKPGSSPCEDVTDIGVMRQQAKEHQSSQKAIRSLSDGTDFPLQHTETASAANIVILGMWAPDPKSLLLKPPSLWYFIMEASGM